MPTDAGRGLSRIARPAASIDSDTRRDDGPRSDAHGDRAAEARRPGRAVDPLPAVQGHDLPQGSRGPAATSARSATTTSPSRPATASRQLLDEDSFEEWYTDLRPCDPLGFTDRIPYAQRLDRGADRRPGCPTRPWSARGSSAAGRSCSASPTSPSWPGSMGVGRRREADPGRRGGDASCSCR